MIGQKSDMVGRLVGQDRMSDFFNTSKTEKSQKIIKKSLKNLENFLRLYLNFVSPTLSIFHTIFSYLIAVVIS